MRTKSVVLVIMVVLGFLCISVAPVAADTSASTNTVPAADTVHSYTEAIGPDNPLYGLKIALENFDESFSVNQNDRLEKEINHTDLRLSELEGALADNNTEAINRTMDLYWEKFNQTEDTLGQMGFNNTRNISEPWNMSAPHNAPLINIQNMLTRHQEVMQNLMQRYPDRGNLRDAYNRIQAVHTFGPRNERGPGSLEQVNTTPQRQQDHLMFPGTRGANQSWEQTGGARNTTSHGPEFTNRTEQNQRQLANPGPHGGQSQSSDHQIGNRNIPWPGNGNAIDNGNGNSRQHPW